MRVQALLCCFLLFGHLVACDKTEDSLNANEVLTQKVREPGRTPVTVLVKYAFSIHAFEKVVEERFPNIDLVQVGNFTQDRGLVEYLARLEHDDLADIVMTWPLQLGEKYWKDRLLDLSAMPFTNRYITGMLDAIARDGKLYYLPGPAQVRGIVYNKTLFKEKGWQVPTNYEEFIELCHTIEASGIRALQLGFSNSEVLDTAFVGFNYRSSFRSPADMQWLADYNDKKQGSFGDQFGNALNVFQQMIDEGVWKPGDINVRYSQRENMFFNRECAMIEDSVLIARLGYDRTGSTDEVALMPFFNPGTPSDWVRLYMVCYIGLNKHLAEPQNKAKYDLVMQLMDFISSPEGQIALSADTGAMFSSLRNAPPPDVPEIIDIDASLRQGRYAVFPELKYAQGALRSGLAGMVSGYLTAKDVILMVDKQNLNPPPVIPPSVLGKAETDFSIIETGNFITDVIRAKTGADIALFLDNGKDGTYNGKGICSRLYKGQLTTADIFRLMPDMKHGEVGSVQILSMTGANLCKALEYAVTVNNGESGWFYYFSGLRMAFAPTAAPGSRIKEISLADGKALDPNHVYLVAAMDNTVDPKYVSNLKETGILIEDLLIQTIREKKTIAPSGDGRFNIR